MSHGNCPACRTALPEASAFCPKCGHALGDRERPRQSATGGGWTEFLDRAWDFFASTKVAWTLIILIALASAVGTFIEQESLYQDWRPPHMYYPDRYGEFWGNLYLKLGLTHAYSSIWFATLILLLVINLIICSLQRLVPLHRMLVNPQVWKLPHFIRRQEVVVEVPGDLASVEARLKKRGYKMIRDRECAYGDKGRLSRYGPYILHIGLIIVCMAGFSKALPGWDVSKDVWIPDGQTVKVPDTDFALTNHKFTMELYPNGAPSRFATDASVIVDGKETLRQTIEVNHPVAYGGWEIYQASFRQEPGIATIKVMGALAKQQVTTIAFDLRQPQAEYPIGDKLKMAVRSYYHDFVVDPATQQGTNGSFEVKNPVLMAEFLTTDTNEVVGRAALIILAKDAEPVYEGPIYLTVDKIENRWETALKLHKDRTTPYMYTGLAVVMLGMVITFFIFHWQVWVREENGRVLVGARAFKNKFGLKQEMKRIFGEPEGEGKTA